MATSTIKRMLHQATGTISWDSAGNSDIGALVPSNATPIKLVSTATVFYQFGYNPSAQKWFALIQTWGGSPMSAGSATVTVTYIL